MQLDPQIVDHVLRAQYNIAGDIRPLPGELDLNYAVRSGADRYVLKIMRCGCDPAFVSLQARAMDHIRSRGLAQFIPDVIRTTDGQLVSTVTDGENDDRVAWLITFLPGTLMADLPRWSPGLTKNIGRTMGQLVNALADYDHDLLDRNLKWDLRHAGWIKEHLDIFDNPGRRERIAGIAGAFAGGLGEQLTVLPHVPIHNDANEMNLLIAEGNDASHQVSGVIDFGDMVRTARICEPAIAMAYAMMRGGDWLGRGAALAAGFHTVSPLSEAEIALLLPLVEVRLAICVTNAAIETKRHPDNEYLAISEKPAWELLGRLAETDRRDAEEVIRKECEI